MRVRLAIVNRLLTAAVAGLGIYLVASPVLPSLQLQLQRWTDRTQGYRYASALSRLELPDVDLPEPPEGNRLIIPKIRVETAIVEGTAPAALDSGVWRRPGTGTPDLGGNTVLAGHRFMYTAGPNTFYNLDQVQVGDKLAIFWDDVEYDYEVTSIDVVEPTDTYIEDPTAEPMLTLYTCTPVLTAADRLVVRAKPIDLSKEVAIDGSVGGPK